MDGPQSAGKRCFPDRFRTCRMGMARQGQVFGRGAELHGDADLMNQFARGWAEHIDFARAFPMNGNVPTR